MARIYIPAVLGEGYPAGRDVRYECLRCGGVVASMPTYDEPWTCSCRNVRVDADAGRVSVDRHEQLRVFREA